MKTALHTTKMHGCSEVVPGQFLSDCTSLKICVPIPSSIIAFGDDAFKNCSSISDIYYEGTQEPLEAIETG